MFAIHYLQKAIDTAIQYMGNWMQKRKSTFAYIYAMFKPVFAFLVLLVVWHAHGQQNPIVGWYAPVTAPAKDPQPKGYEKPVVIPLKMSGNLMLIEATVDEQTGYFILDTGAPYLVLNSTYFRDYPHLQEYEAMGVNREAADIFRTRVAELSLRGITYSGIDADVASLGHLENNRGVKIFGLLGTNLFTHFVVGINVAQQMVTLYKPTDFDEKQGQTTFNVVPFTLHNNTISLPVVLGGVALSFVLDTGAELNVIDNNLNDSAYQDFIIQKRSVLNGAVGDEIEVLSGVVMHTYVGGLHYLNMKTILTDLADIGRVYDVKIDGILGYEFFAKAPVFIDFANKELKINIKPFYE